MGKMEVHNFDKFRQFILSEIKVVIIQSLTVMYQNL